MDTDSCMTTLPWEILEMQKEQFHPIEMLSCFKYFRYDADSIGVARAI